MSGSLRVYRQRIRSTQSLKKIFRAMELIAASRIGKARERVVAATPYTRAITRALSAVATHGDIEHSLLNERTDTNRVAVLVVASDRGMAGAYSANVLREAERLLEQLAEEGKEVDLYAYGRRAISYFTFRHRKLVGTWAGSSDAPTVELANEIADRGLQLFTAAVEDGGVAELHIVYTHFRNMVSQAPRVLRVLPMEVVEGVVEPGSHDTMPFYEFEPDPATVLDMLLPHYVRTVVYNALLQAAASELANRQRAMHTATENAEELIRTYTRQANQARQAEITQEISEIVSGADALAASR